MKPIDRQDLAGPPTTFVSHSLRLVSQDIIHLVGPLRLGSTRLFEDETHSFLHMYDAMRKVTGQIAQRRL